MQMERLTKDDEMTKPRLSEDKCGRKGRTQNKAFYRHKVV